MVNTTKQKSADTQSCCWVFPGKLMEWNKIITRILNAPFRELLCTPTLEILFRFYWFLQRYSTASENIIQKKWEKEEKFSTQNVFTLN